VGCCGSIGISETTPDASSIVDTASVPVIGVNVVAIGNGPNPVLLDTIEGLKLNKWGNIEADEKSCKTNIDDIFAGGDIVTGAATVIAAMGAGKHAARSIDKFLQS